MSQAKREFRDYITTGYGDFAGGIKYEGTDFVTVTGTTAERMVTIQADGSTPGSFGVKVLNEDAGANGATLILQHDSATPADGDEVGSINAFGDNDAGETTVYGTLVFQALDVSDASEDGKISLKVITAGTGFVEYLSLNDVNSGLLGFERAVKVAKANIAAGVGGAIPLTTPTVTVNTDAGGDAFTLANGLDGQRITIVLVVDGGGDAVITPTTFANGSTITMGDASDSIDLEYDTTIGWFIRSNSGCVIA